jgi:uncharacterized protein (DUF433 family)
MAHPLISRDPKIMVGKPCFAGTRIPIYLIIEKLAYGTTWDEIRLDYDLSPEQIKAALLYAAELTDVTIEVPVAAHR